MEAPVSFEDCGRYVRAVWPSATLRFEELCESGISPASACERALGEVEGLTWSHHEAMVAAGLGED